MNEQPTQYSKQPTLPNRRQVMVAVIFLVICIIGYQVYRAQQFHLVRTEPGSSNIASISPSISFDFNQSLSASSVKLSPDSSLFSSYRVSGKSVIVTLASPLSVNTKHTITMNGVTSTAGHTTNVHFTFNTKDIPFAKLTKQQQAAILAQQTNRPPSRDNYSYVGSDLLLNHGLGIVQLEDLKQALFSYIQSSKLTVQQITFKNPIFTPYDPHGTSNVSNATFTITFDSSHTYNAVLDFHDLTAARLHLYDQTSGSQVYDSQDIDLSTGAN